jgi:hypothetical protein
MGEEGWRGPAAVNEDDGRQHTQRGAHGLRRSVNAVRLTEGDQEDGARRLIVADRRGVNARPGRG